MSNNKSAIDIIYEMPDNTLALESKILSIESKIAFLDKKINIILESVSKLSISFPATDGPANKTEEHLQQTQPEESEVMEIRQQISQPFSFDKKPEKPAEAPALTILPKQSDAIRIPSKEVDPMPQNAIQSAPVQEKQTSTLIRGRLKEREGSSIAAVDVKIFDEKSVMVKKTKTAATGEWIAMLPPGEYTAEFTKPGQKPLFKPISIIAGKKEVEILI